MSSDRNALKLPSLLYDGAMMALTKKITTALAFLVVAFGGGHAGRASDHSDGLKTAVDLAGDLTDLFSFTSPQDPNKLVLIMNTHSLSNTTSQFSDVVHYKFRIRPITDAKTLTPSSDPTTERSIVCTFAGGVVIVQANQQATCVLTLDDGTETVHFQTRSSDYTAGGEGTGPSGTTRIFAGVRSDPWFVDVGKLLKWDSSKAVDPTSSGSNTLSGQNILSIVVELDKSRLPSLFAVNAQTERQ